MAEEFREIVVPTKDELDLFVRINNVQTPDAVVVLVHGLAEHSGRYEHVVNFFNRLNYSVYRFDLRGHGNSGGEKGYVEDFHQYIDDADCVVRLAQKENPGVPIFMLGHSMGGFITTAYGVRHPDKLQGQILSGAAVILQPSMEPLKETDFDAMAHQTIPNSLSDQISRDRDVVDAYNQDPLVLKEFQFKLVGEVFLKGAQWLMAHMPQYRYPCLILHGGCDEIVTHDASKWMHHHIGSQDKSLNIYESLYHEILNEPEMEMVLSDIHAWISKRLV